MGINLRGVNTSIHYGAPHSIDDYFQESGRGGRTGESARSIVYWKRTDCPLGSSCILFETVKLLLLEGTWIMIHSRNHGLPVAKIPRHSVIFVPRNNEKVSF